jgi:hypothetical protein
MKQEYLEKMANEEKETEEEVLANPIEHEEEQPEIEGKHVFRKPPPKRKRTNDVKREEKNQKKENESAKKDVKETKQKEIPPKKPRQNPKLLSFDVTEE